MNTTVSFELAKLLKKKEFNEDCYRTYNHLGELSPFPLLENMEGEPILNPLDYKWRNSLIHHSVTAAPTIADVVMWLHEKHNIWISVIITYPKTFEYSIVKLDSAKELARIHQQVNSPTKAYEVAILYTLTNLI